MVFGKLLYGTGRPVCGSDANWGRPLGSGSAVERKAAVQARESGEVVVGGVNGGAVRDGERGDLGIGDEIPAGRGRLLEQVEHLLDVGRIGLQDTGYLPAKPGGDVRGCLGQCHWRHIGARVGADAYEGEDHRVGQSDRLVFRETLFPPAARRAVEGRSIVVRVEQQIDVGNDRGDVIEASTSSRVSFRKASTSSSSPSF